MRQLGCKHRVLVCVPCLSKVVSAGGQLVAERKLQLIDLFVHEIPFHAPKHQAVAMTRPTVLLVFVLVHKLDILDQVLTTTRKTNVFQHSLKYARRREPISIVTLEHATNLACGAHGIMEVVLMEALREPKGDVLQTWRVIAERLELSFLSSLELFQETRIRAPEQPNVGNIVQNHREALESQAESPSDLCSKNSSHCFVSNSCFQFTVAHERTLSS